MVITLIAFSAYLLLALVTFDSKDPGWTFVGNVNAVQNAAGRAGAFSADLLLSLFGFMAYLFPVLVGFWAGKVLKERHAGLPNSWPLFSLRLVGFILTMLAGTALSYMHFTVGAHLPEGAGGILGHGMGQAALDGFNPLGGTLIMVALFLIGVTIFTDLSWIALAEGLGGLVLAAVEKVPAWWRARKEKREAQKQKKEAHEKRAKVISEAKKKAETRKPVKIAEPAKPVEKSVRVQKEKQQKLFTTEVTGELPPIGLLDQVEESKGGYSEEALEGIGYAGARKD